MWWFFIKFHIFVGKPQDSWNMRPFCQGKTPSNFFRGLKNKVVSWTGFFAENCVLKGTPFKTPKMAIFEADIGLKNRVSHFCESRFQDFWQENGHRGKWLRLLNRLKRCSNCRVFSLVFGFLRGGPWKVLAENPVLLFGSFVKTPLKLNGEIRWKTLFKGDPL